MGLPLEHEPGLWRIWTGSRDAPEAAEIEYDIDDDGEEYEGDDLEFDLELDLGDDLGDDFSDDPDNV